MNSNWILFTAVLTFATACANADDAEAPLSARDSAGITIVESPGAAWTAETRWQIPEMPILQIGEDVDGAAEKQFANISAVHQLANGAIGVVDSWIPAVMFFDSTGAHLGRAGAVGNGPGEFPRRAFLRSFACGYDTLYIIAARQVSAFTPPNRFIRSFPLQGPVRISACASNRFAVQQFNGGSRNAVGVFTDSVVLNWVDAHGTAVSVIDTLPWQENDWIRSAEGPGYSRLLFGRVLSIAAQGSGIVTGFGETLSIDMRDSTGRIVRVARAAGMDRKVEATDIERFERFVFDPWAGNPAERAQLESRLASAAGRPLPAYAELQVDSRGNVWTRQYDHLDAVAFYDYSSLNRSFKRPQLDEPRKWHVFQQDGRYLGEIGTPSRFIVHQIGNDWILGVWRDGNDIEFVRKYALRKPD